MTKSGTEEANTGAALRWLAVAATTVTMACDPTPSPASGDSGAGDSGAGDSGAGGSGAGGSADVPEVLAYNLMR
ncbi:hypothetical protein KEG38_52080 [Polyangium jinanense]|uniref:hypothetical protein n=1 Tax=Polyangium jinanense TaxID=2829994 RepID=UPI002341D876|nr:hypothetical protein [Polyangium jinanense]MDC3962464.1 hypothetical protein [Polyangium jinanense]